MAWTSTDRAFKILINRRVTSSGKQYYEEIGDNTINVHIDEVWSQTLSVDPAVSVAAGIAELKTLFTMTEETSVGSQQCYYAYSGGVRLKDWISGKYGSDYEVKLYQNNGTQIFPTDPSGWFFDYPTGILTFMSTASLPSKPFKITGYRYIGSKGASGSVPLATDTTAGKVYIASNNSSYAGLGPTALRTDDSRVLKWNSAGIGTHGFLGDATVFRDATVGGRLLSSQLKVGALIYPSSDSTAGYVLTTDGSGNLYFSTTSLLGKEMYQIYDVTSSNPTIFHLAYPPLNPNSVRMFPDGGVEFTNTADFTVSAQNVTYLSPSPIFESGDRVIFKYTRQ